MSACSTHVVEIPRIHIPDPEKPYILDPLIGYPLSADPGLEDQITQGFAALTNGVDLAALEASVRELGEREPGFHPAQVLLAQVIYLRQIGVGVSGGSSAELRETARLITPAADELPDYLAVQLFLGRVAERLDDPVLAFAAFQKASGGSSEARRKVEELKEPVTEILVDDLQNLLEQGLLDEAARQLSYLESWSEDRSTLLVLRRELAYGLDDVEMERTALESLFQLDPQNDEWSAALVRIYKSSMEERTAILKLEEMLTKRPEDKNLLDELENVRFRWRVQLLPAHVQEIAAKNVINRAELASLLYWLIPSVRNAELTDPPIATDILEHPRRREILPVMILGLIPVDETLHRFSPDQPASRALTLGALLGLLNFSQTELSCLSSTETRALSASLRLTCQKAAQCGLIPEEAECLPQAEISGPETLDLFRQALDFLDTRSAG